MDAYRISENQGSYNCEAAETMRLVTYEDDHFALTPEVRTYVGMDPKQRGDFLARRMLRIPIMNRIFQMVRERPRHGVGREEIAALIERTSHLSCTTPMRRASTVLSYFRWLASGVVGRKGWRGGRIFMSFPFTPRGPKIARKRVSVQA